jgi:alanine dehydrogenase
MEGKEDIMDFGVPLERHRNENRVGLSPRGARILTDLGHRVFVETGAGAASRFPDSEYREAGADLVFRREEVFRRAEVIVAVTAPSAEEVALTTEGQVLLAFWHMAVAAKPLVAEMARRKLTAIGFEAIEEAGEHRPVLHSMSELAGQMTIHTAANLLQTENGGRGVLLGSAPGMPPANIVILGAGTVGRAAARAGIGTGARVIVLDNDVDKLHRVVHEFHGRVTTDIVNQLAIARYVQRADVIIGAVLVPGGHAPYLVTKEMVATMKPGAVILDVSIDQGGCVETSRPTTLEDPTFIVHDVVHYCVGNMTASIPRTASKALTYAHMRYLEQIAEKGVDGALRERAALRKGTTMYRGAMTHAPTAAAFGLEYASVEELLGREVR